MKREQMQLKVTELVHAEWNPRTAAELDAGHPEMQKLIASVHELGVVQPIAVWDDGERLVVIAGNRRFAAAQAAGVEELPAMVFTGITLGQAQEITRVENEVRLGINPIKDAELIGSMLSLGYDQKEIAAHFGVSEATVCRRAKLTGLVPAIRQIAVESGKITTAALEMMALYPSEIQNSCVSAVKRSIEGNTSEAIGWSRFSWEFDRQTKDLANVKFDTTGCETCIKRTGAQADLFGSVKPNKDGTLPLGSCLDCKCFNEKYTEHKKKMVMAKVGSDVELVPVDSLPFSQWDFDTYPELIGDRRSKKRNVCYWDYDEYDGGAKVWWGVPLEKIIDEVKKQEDREEAQREAEEAARKAANKKRAKIQSERDEIAKLRKPYCNEFDSAIRQLDAIWRDAGDDVEAAIYEHIVGSAGEETVAKLLAELIYVGSEDWQLRQRHPECWLVIFEAYPKFARALKVKPSQIAAARQAKDKLDAFDAEHPMPEFED